MDQEPKRLLESSRLSAGERRLLEAGRERPPVHFDVERGAARFHASLQTLAAAQPTQPRVKLGRVAKVGLVVVPVLMLVAALQLLRTRAPGVRPAPARRSVTVQPTRAPVAAVRSVVVQRDTQTEVPSPPTRHVRRSPRLPLRRNDTAARAPVSEAKRPQPAAARVALKESPDARRPLEHALLQPLARAAASDDSPTTSSEAPIEAADSLDELHAIARARGLLIREPEAAIALLERVARLHPKGYFIEEREALLIFALVAAGRHDQAQRRAVGFLHDHPSSPFAARVRAVAER